MLSRCLLYKFLKWYPSMSAFPFTLTMLTFPIAEYFVVIFPYLVNENLDDGLFLLCKNVRFVVLWKKKKEIFRNQFGLHPNLLFAACTGGNSGSSQLYRIPHSLAWKYRINLLKFRLDALWVFSLYIGFATRVRSSRLRISNLHTQLNDFSGLGDG